MSINQIPIHVINTQPTGLNGLSGNAHPLLLELAEYLKRLLDTGETSAIDLSALPLTPADLDWLKEKLGEGEIKVSLQANGLSTLNETACPGIWWVTHHNEQGAVTTQLLEVSFVPELVKTDVQDVQTGLEYVQILIHDL